MKSFIILFIFQLVIVPGGNAHSEIPDSLWVKDLHYLNELIDENYAHLYYNISREDFNRQVIAFEKEIPVLEDHEIIVGFAKLIASFKVGHSGIPLNKSMHGEALSSGFHTLPVNFYLFSDGLFIEGSTKEFESIVGAKVLEIGNQSVEEALHAIRPVVSLENESFFKAYGIPMLSCPEILHAQGVIKQIQEVRLLIEKEGKIKEVHLPAYQDFHIPAQYGFISEHNSWVSFRKKEQTPLWLKNLAEPGYYEYLKKHKAIYVRQSMIRNGSDISIDSIYKEIFAFVEAKPVDKFILDLRLNGGGNNYLNKPILLGMIKSKVNQKGKFITLIGRRTFSAAQNLVNELENYTETSFIGESTAENVNFFGDVNLEKLPYSGLSVRLSYLWWQDKDPRDKRRATSPELSIELSSSDYRNNIDPVLNAALNYHNVLPQTLVKLKKLLVSDKYEEAKLFTMEYIANPENHLQLGELRSRLNQMGYEHMQTDLPLAKEVFKLNTQLFPKNANVWDSLGEACMNDKEFDKSIELYKKAIAIDPNGPVGKHAREMINEIVLNRKQ